MFCSLAIRPSALQTRTCYTYPWMKFDLRGHNRTPVAIVPTAINGTIRLNSDFEVRYSSLFESYIYHIDIFGSLLGIHAQHAPGNPLHVSHHSFHVCKYRRSSDRMDFQSTIN